MLTMIAPYRSEDFSVNRDNSALFSKGPCRYSYVSKPVSKLRKREVFATTKENDLKCPMPSHNTVLSRNVTVQAKGTNSHCQSKELLKLLDNKYVRNRDAKLQCHKEGLPSLEKKKKAVMAGEVNSEAYRVRSPCLTEKSTPLKNKASKNLYINSCITDNSTPLKKGASKNQFKNSCLAENSSPLINKASKNPFINSSQWKKNVVRSISSIATKKLIKKISEVDCSSPSLPSDPAIIDDALESDLVSSEMSEPELLDLALLPDELLPEKWITTPVYMSQQSEGSIAGEFHSFDGSRFSPIEEASLILNSTIVDVRSIESHRNSSSPMKSAIVDNDMESYLLSSDISEQELQNMNFLPDDFSPEKQTIISLSTPEKSQRITAEGFHSFDGSRFSPIQEAFLILNSPLTDVSACVADKEAETTSEDIELEEEIKDVEEINAVNRIRHNENPIPALVPVGVLHLPESKDILSASVSLLQSGKNSKEFDDSQDVKILAEMKKVVKERMLELLEAELLNVKVQIKGLGRTLKCSLRRTDIMQGKLASLSENF